ncbi:hypothetical protein [Fontivita pretiosa]|uniref:hypothetical protein n=1 Tax=Fontivita pretiosa TaxID=2989684 RepID=UPI003D184F1E
MNRFKRIGWIMAAAMALAMQAGEVAAAGARQPVDTVNADVLPAAPLRRPPAPLHAPQARRDRDQLQLSNAFLTVEISESKGTVLAIVNHLTSRRYVLSGDVIGATIITGAGKLEWTDRRLTSVADAQPHGDQRLARIVLEQQLQQGLSIRVTYTLHADEHWLQRQISIDSGDAKPVIDRLIYGSAEIDGGRPRVLELGRFDRPRIISVADDGGTFAGVGHWFYQVRDDGTFQNQQMGWKHNGGVFDAEPFYLGVFASEPGEPYPGWMWYRGFLERRKASAARHATWFSWNAGWGQWGVDIDDPVVPAYLKRMAELGIDGVIFGSGGLGKGIDGFIKLAKTDATTQANLAELKRLRIAGGTLNNGQKKWDDPAAQPALIEELNAYAAAGFQTTAFDFYSSPDTYVAHRNTSDYFHAALEKLQYTECHLGMAVYGPQFQRLVRVNHPDDIHGFDIAHFSADWATFLAFRDSRRNWQRKYEYLMPEDGLYYFLTHYSNWGNPRRYTDPEPQQFTYSVHAYCGIGFNFHDTFGWRETIAASSAFTAAPVFGHIEMKMPAADVAYARRFFDWMRDNADVLRPARACAETQDHCVVSKIVHGRGLIYVLNYAPGTRRFELKLKTGHDGPLLIRQIYPSLEQAQAFKDGDTLKASVRGESCAIFEVNGALKTLPPTNRSSFPIDLADWSRQEDQWTTGFHMPDMRAALEQASDPTLPRELLSLDQVQDTRPDLLNPISPDGSSNLTAAVKWIGKGKLPAEYLKTYGFTEQNTVETWKIVPWAYADRVWLIYRPNKPVLMTSPAQPTLAVNDQQIPLVPRVDHRFERVEQWTCPLYYADITGVVRFGEHNSIRIGEPEPTQDPPLAYVLTAADRQ